MKNWVCLADTEDRGNRSSHSRRSQTGIKSLTPAYKAAEVVLRPSAGELLMSSFGVVVNCRKLITWSQPNPATVLE